MKTFLTVVGVLIGISYFVHDMSEVMLLWRGDDVEPNLKFQVMLRTSYAPAAIALLFLAFTFTKENLIQRVLGKALEGMPEYVFRNVNVMWIVFLLAVAVLNYYVMTNLDTKGWCLWKLLGSLPLFVAFCIAQLAYFSSQAKKNNIIFEAKS